MGGTESLELTKNEYRRNHVLHTRLLNAVVPLAVASVVDRKPSASDRRQNCHRVTSAVAHDLLIAYEQFGYTTKIGEARNIAIRRTE